MTWSPAAAARDRRSFQRATATAFAAVKAPLVASLELLRSPLTRNGFALTASAAITSVLGLVFWIWPLASIHPRTLASARP